MNFSSTLGRALTFSFCLLAIVGLTVFFPGQAESGGLGQTGHFEYAPTSYAESSGNQCPAGLRCWELCFVGPNGSQGTGQLCCVDANGECHNGVR